MSSSCWRIWSGSSENWPRRTRLWTSAWRCRRFGARWLVGALVLAAAVATGMWSGAGRFGWGPSLVDEMPEVIQRDDFTYDLLEHIRLTRDVLSPPQVSRWSLTPQGLIMPPGDSTTKLKYRVATSENFHLELDVSRRSGLGPFAVGVVARERQFIFLVDRERSVLLLTANSRAAENVRDAVELTTDARTRLDIYVKGNTVELRGNGVTLLQWPDIDALDRYPRQGWNIGDAEAFFLGSNDSSSFEVTHLHLEPLQLED